MSENFEILLKDFFSEIFYEKCVVEDSSVTSEEQDSLNSLNFVETLDNLKNVFRELLNFKKIYLSQDKFEVVKTNEKFEAMLQKLEAEVRNHIRVEHQLKLHIENTQCHSEELESMNQRLTLQVKELTERNKIKTETRSVMEKITKLEGEVNKKDLVIARLEAENMKLKKMLEGKENGRREEGFKQKCEENFNEVFKLEQVLKEIPTRTVMRDRNKSVRKSCVENEMMQSKTKGRESSYKNLSKVHSRSSSEQGRPVSALRKRC